MTNCQIYARPLDERAYKQIRYRQRMLPAQLDLARRKVVALEREAKRLGMYELLIDQGASQ